MREKEIINQSIKYTPEHNIVYENVRKRGPQNDYKSHVTLCTLLYLHPTSELHDPNFHLQLFQDRVDEILPINVPPECQMKRRSYPE